jgi:hypothetical protein
LHSVELFVNGRHTGKRWSTGVICVTAVTGVTGEMGFQYHFQINSLNL